MFNGGSQLQLQLLLKEVN